MYLIALSTVLFHALATIAMLVGVAIDSFRPVRLTRD